MLVSYIPVLHAGYLKFFREYFGERLFVVDSDLLADIEYFGREIRALNPEEAKTAIESLGILRSVEILTAENINVLNSSSVNIVMPDEDITRHLSEKYFPEAHVTFKNIFLRWHKNNVSSEREIDPDRKISRRRFDREIMSAAYREAEKSSDWWRQVGAVAVREDKVRVVAHNSHMPSPHSPYADGDPRTPFTWGERTDLSSAAHAEKSVIAYAAKNGIALADAELYVTTFPCPSCALSVVLAGFKRLFYSEGYSLVSARDVFKAYGVEVVLVKMDK